MQKTSSSAEETLALARNLAHNLSGGEILLLSGTLGAGKTVFAKGIAQGLSINKNEVISPTFVLLRVHKGKMILQHFDLYRIKSPQDMLALGYEEYFYSSSDQSAKPAVTVIEWPERLKFLLPSEFLKIRFVLKGKEKRLLEFTAKGRKYKILLEKFNKRPIIKKEGRKE